MRGDDGGPPPVCRDDVFHGGAGLARDERAGGVVPRREVQFPVGVDLAGGDAAEVERGGAAPAQVADAAHHPGRRGSLPLTVAGVRSRSRRALVWPLLALLGVLALTEPWKGDVDVLGLLFAALAGTGWGIYIVLTQHVGDRFGGIDGLAISIPVAAVVTAFFGIPQSLGGLTLGVVALSAVLAVLMPVIPYTFELIALRRLTAASFGTLMAIEPALGVLMGVLILHQVPGPLQVLGVALVVIAGLGAARIGHRDDGPLVLEPPGI